MENCGSLERVNVVCEVDVVQKQTLKAGPNNPEILTVISYRTNYSHKHGWIISRLDLTAFTNKHRCAMDR